MHRALTHSQIDLARRRKAAGETLIEIAADFGVHRRTVSEAIRGVRWYSRPIGPGQPRVSKFTANEIRDIRRRKAAGKSRGSIARDLKVSVSTISDIVNRNSYD